MLTIKRNLLCQAVIFGMIIAGLLLPVPSQADDRASGYQELKNEANQGNSIFLPFTSNERKMKTVFGIQMPRIDDEHGLQHVKNAQSSWVRRSFLDWASVEQVEGQYEWKQPKIAALEKELIEANADGMEVILVVHQTPAWAQLLPGYTCGPVKPDKLPAFGRFIYQAVSRYSKPPYNVRFWQIWNEPEAEPVAVRPTGGLGCWGDPNDLFFGGGYFGDALKAVYPKLKEANPNAKLVLGGLLLACNPDKMDCAVESVLFFEGVLNRHGEKDGGRYIDLVAFHGYDHYAGQLGRYENNNWLSSWDDEGPVIIAKADYVRKVMKAYGVDLPLMVTEAALLCGRTGNESHCLTSDFEKTKAYYVAELYGASLAEGLQTTIWYHILGWRKSELLDKNLNPLPAYDAYKFARLELRNGVFQRRITDYPGLVVYEIKRSDRIVWLLWSQVGEKKITLSNTPLAIWDVFGNRQEKTAHDLVVKLMPLYLEWPLQ